jgi:hypothetical protein
MMSFEDSAKSLDFEGTIVGLIISAFGFVAALFWKDAITELIDSFVPTGEGVTYKFIAAILVTVLAVVAIFVLVRYVTRIDDKLREKALKGKARKQEK